MAFLTQRILQSSLRLPATILAAQEFERPDLVVLPVRDGFSPCGKPPVRIFLGTEAAQYKAERVFIWSIEQVRDPARVYEVYLMKHLRGFRSRFWLTGFTNYRFAVPQFAGATGRAIYNDVDQIYLKDPALLFDLDMGEHSYLAIHPGDISVALFDCERMARVWSLEDAQTGRKNPLLARASSVAGQWGQLAQGWNARDREYVRGQSGLLHYTALHRQPWHPFPRLFVYHANPAADVWFDLERSANAAGFQVFAADRPSQAFRKLREAAQVLAPANTDREPSAAAPGRSGLQQLLQDSRAHTVLACRIAAAATTPAEQLPALAGAGCTLLEEFDPTAQPGEEPATRADAVVCFEALEYVPDDDIPWLLQQLFARAAQLVYCEVGAGRGQRGVAAGTGLRHRSRPVEWWQYQFELVARQHPSVRWRLCSRQGGSMRRGQSFTLEGNECSNRDAEVWVIADHKPGHTGQAIALAEKISWPYQLMRVPMSLGALLLVMLRLDSGRVGKLQPPWPDVVVACGWWSARVARWIKRRSGGRARLLLGGRKCGPVRSPTDILVSCEHFHLPVHERRIETILPLQPITSARLDAARERGEQLMAGAARPRVALLVGGATKQHLLTPADAAALGRQVLEKVQQTGGSLFAISSRRTGSRAAAALAQSLQGAAAELHRWSRDEPDNPYPSYLAAADILIVTGESESMLTDAIATGKPVYIYPLRQRRYGPWLSLGARLAEWSERRPKNRRGTERPQQGLEYFCSRVLKREWILPPRDLEGLHRRLVAQGWAHMLDAAELSAAATARPAIDDELGRRLRIMLAHPPARVAATAGRSADVTIEA